MQVDIGHALQQQAAHLAVAIGGREVQWCTAFNARACVYWRAPLEEQLANNPMALLSGNMKRAQAALVRRCQVARVSEQEPHNVYMAVLRTQVQWSAAILVSLVQHLARSRATLPE